MKQAVGNPSSNALKPGLNATDLAGAVAKSGYPLQTIVAEQLAPDFPVMHREWAYVDSDSGDLRSLDLAAELPILDGRTSSTRIRPTLDLLIECKQSELPYMFFIDDVKTGGFIAEFPLMVGLQKMEVATTTDDDPSTWRFSVQQALSLESLPFIAPGPPRCSTFSKCVRKGKEVELSGTESFFGLVLPLLKSLQYFERTRQPLKTFMYFDLHAALAVGVLDAPMVGVRMASGNDTYELLPWVRVMRHETKEDAPFFERDRLFAVDIVHRDFLGTYVKDHVLPFGKELATRALAHEKALCSGRGFLPGLGNAYPSDIYSHLGPPRPAQRTRAVLRIPWR